MSGNTNDRDQFNKMFESLFGSSGDQTPEQERRQSPMPMPDLSQEGEYAKTIKVGFAELERAYEMYDRFRREMQDLIISDYMIEGFDALSDVLATIQEMLSNDYSDSESLDKETRELFRKTRKFKVRLLSSLYVKYFGDEENEEKEENC
jgi:hypothetical protein